MNIYLDALEAAAKAATPGPWKNAAGYKIEVAATGTHCASAWERYTYETGKEITAEQAKANATYIATANPAVVLELVTELRRQRKAMQRLARALRVKTRALAIAQRECKYAQERAAMNGRPV